MRSYKKAWGRPGGEPRGDRIRRVATRGPPGSTALTDMGTTPTADDRGGAAVVGHADGDGEREVCVATLDDESLPRREHDGGDVQERRSRVAAGHGDEPARVTGSRSPRGVCTGEMRSCVHEESRDPMPRPLRYSINVTLDGCVDHRAAIPDEDLHRHAAESIARADALILGRVTYEMMESAWRPVAEGARPDWVADWMVPFAKTIDAAKKYVVSSTLERVDWNAELVRGDLEQALRLLKQESGQGLATGGVKLPMALAELGLIDEYEVVVHPRLVGHGPTLFAGLSKIVDLTLVDHREFRSGAVAVRYALKR